MTDNLIEIRDLNVAFHGQPAVRNLCLDIRPGECLALVGESGSGKSVTAHSILQLLPESDAQTTGSIRYRGQELLGADPKVLRELRGNRIAMIFQEPMTALNPVHKIGRQISEVLLLHTKMSKKEAWQESIRVLDSVGIPAPDQRINEYPHQLSGGMRQRVVIAMALACKPDLVIADEPTTALDVTVQAEILDLINKLQKEMGMSVIMITHDLGVIAETCDEVVVMYAGRVVERGDVHTIFKKPVHAYTKALLNSIPSLDAPRKSELSTIPGTVEGIADFVEGCRFCQRMSVPVEQLTERPNFIEIEKGHWVENCPTCNSQRPAMA